MLSVVIETVMPVLGLVFTVSYVSVGVYVNSYPVVDHLKVCQ